MNKMEGKLGNVLSMSRGIILRMVMSDWKLTIEVKAIYTYFAACIETGDTSIPPVGEICKVLNM